MNGNNLRMNDVCFSIYVRNCDCLLPSIEVTVFNVFLLFCPRTTCLSVESCVAYSYIYTMQNTLLLCVQASYIYFIFL